MANRTVKDANSIHGTNPQYLIEKIIRTRIYDSRYWKEQCFALSAELLVDKGMQLRSIGGIYGGNVKPTPFICLVLKMLQIQPEKDIIIEFIKQDDFKYVRALGAMYLRLVYSSLDCYKYLEPLLNDYRKLRFMNRSGSYELLHMDEYIDNLLREERYLDIILPRVQKRWIHESNTELEARISLLDDDLDDLESESDEEEEEEEEEIPVPEHTRSRDESRSHREKHRHSPGRERRDRDHKEKRHRSRSRDRERKRRRSRSRERHHRMPDAYHPRDQEMYDYRRGQPEWYDPRREARPEREYRGEREMRDYGREEREHAGRMKAHHRDDRIERKERRRDRDSRKEKPRRERRNKEDMSKEEWEIAEANDLRAQLGLPPLR